MVQAKIKLARDEGQWPGWNQKKDENGELVEDENAAVFTDWKLHQLDST